MLSQAEHDELASAILITTSEKLAKEVSLEVDKFTEILSRREIIEKSLENYGCIFVADTLEDAIDSVDDFIKKSSIISYSREALAPVYKDIVQFAECEELTAHANSIRVRFE